MASIRSSPIRLAAPEGKSGSGGHRQDHNLGRASVKNESELAQFAYAALTKLKELPEKVRAFFGDPALRYIRDSLA